MKKIKQLYKNTTAVSETIPSS